MVEPVGTVLGGAEAGWMETAGMLAGTDLFLRWYVLHQDLIWFAVRTSRPACSIAFMTSLGSALILFTACLL